MKIIPSTGRDNWLGRWAQAEKELARPVVDWSMFRQNKLLVAGIQTGVDKLDMWMRVCRRAGVPMDSMVDSSFGSPVGRYIDGRFYTASSCKNAWYAYTAVNLAQLLGWRRGWQYKEPVRLLEIGGGYGGMVRALCSLLPVQTVTFIDAAPLVTIQRRFVNTTTTAKVVPHNDLRRYDIVTNTMSFGEMPYAAVKSYFGVILTQLSEGGFFYCANRKRRETDFAQYPYGCQWRHSVSYMPNEGKSGLAKGYISCGSVRDSSANSPHPMVLLKA